MRNYVIGTSAVSSDPFDQFPASHACHKVSGAIVYAAAQKDYTI